MPNPPGSSSNDGCVPFFMFLVAIVLLLFAFLYMTSKGN